MFRDDPNPPRGTLPNRCALRTPAVRSGGPAHRATLGIRGPPSGRQEDRRGERRRRGPRPDHGHRGRPAHDSRDGDDHIARPPGDSITTRVARRHHHSAHLGPDESGQVDRPRCGGRRAPRSRGGRRLRCGTPERKRPRGRDHGAKPVPRLRRIPPDSSDVRRSASWNHPEHRPRNRGAGQDPNAGDIRLARPVARGRRSVPLGQWGRHPRHRLGRRAANGSPRPNDPDDSGGLRGAPGRGDEMVTGELDRAVDSFEIVRFQSVGFTWPRISPPGKSPGPVFGGATPSSVCTLTYAFPALIASTSALNGWPASGPTKLVALTVPWARTPSNRPPPGGTVPNRNTTMGPFTPSAAM